MGSQGVLGVVGTATDGVETLRTGLVEPALALGWQVAVTLTPNAGRWLSANGELERLEAVTGLPVRDTPRLPTEPRPHPVADCFVVAPASANFVAKLATGIADNQALTQVSEALGTIGVRWCSSLGSTLPTRVIPRGSSTSTPFESRARISSTGRVCGRCTNPARVRLTESCHGQPSWRPFGK